MTNNIEDESDIDNNFLYNISKRDIRKIQRNTVKKLVSMFPKTLEKYESEITNCIIKSTKRENDVILTKIEISGETYYRHNIVAFLIDKKCNICGLYYKIGDNYNYFLFKNISNRCDALKKYRKLFQ